MSRYLYFAMFLGVVVAVLGGTHWYIQARLVRDTGLGPQHAKIAKWVIWLLGAGMFASFPLSRLVDPPLGRWVLFAPYVWMASVFYLVLLLGASDVVRFVLWAAGKVSGSDGPLAGTAMLAYARVSAVVVLAVVGLVDVAAVKTALRAPVVKNVEVALEGLDPRLDGLRIVQLTDVHLGPILGRGYFDRVLDRVESLRPDLLVVTGDVVDGAAAKRAWMVERLGRLNPPLGKFMVTGNHEFYSDWKQWKPVYTGLGLELLENRCVVLERDGARIAVAGVHDFDGGRFSPEWAPDVKRALSRCGGRADVMLSHQARIVGRARGKVGLVLSGHNHGGQIWPWSYLVLLQQPVVGGLHRFDDTWLYVSQGTGFWGPPMRFLTRSEISLIVLRAAVAENNEKQKHQEQSGG